MAIDTAEKRKAVAGIGFAYYLTEVTPNASKDQEWRQEAANSYPGILAGAPVPRQDLFLGDGGSSQQTRDEQMLIRVVPFVVAILDDLDD